MHGFLKGIEIHRRKGGMHDELVFKLDRTIEEMRTMSRELQDCMYIIAYGQTLES